METFAPNINMLNSLPLSQLKLTVKLKVVLHVTLCNPTCSCDLECILLL